MYTIKRFLAPITAVSLQLVPFLVGAQNPGIDISTKEKLKTNVICPIFDYGFYILMAFAIVMILWAAYIFVMAQDDAEKVTKARKTITYAAVAIVVALIARGFPNLIANIFGAGVNGC